MSHCGFTGGMCQTNSWPGVIISWCRSLLSSILTETRHSKHLNPTVPTLSDCQTLPPSECQTSATLSQITKSGILVCGWRKVFVDLDEKKLKKMKWNLHGGQGECWHFGDVKFSCSCTLARYKVKNLNFYRLTLSDHSHVMLYSTY